MGVARLAIGGGVVTSWWNRKKVAAQVTEALVNGAAPARLCKQCVHRDVSGSYGWECRATQFRVRNLVTGNCDFKGGTPLCSDRRRETNTDCGPGGKLWVYERNPWKKLTIGQKIVVCVFGSIGAGSALFIFMRWWWGYL